jgi:hypothetical protein
MMELFGGIGVRISPTSSGSDTMSEGESTSKVYQYSSYCESRRSTRTRGGTDSDETEENEELYSRDEEDEGKKVAIALRNGINIALLDEACLHE